MRCLAQVLAKIESADAVECLDSILDAVDGAMVARGDLGAELPVECVPFWQSAIVQVHPPLSYLRPRSCMNMAMRLMQLSSVDAACTLMGAA